MLVHPSVHGHLGSFYLLAIVSLLGTWRRTHLSKMPFWILLGTHRRWDRSALWSFYVEFGGTAIPSSWRLHHSVPPAAPGAPTPPRPHRHHLVYGNSRLPRPPPSGDRPSPGRGGTLLGRLLCPLTTPLAGPPARLAAVLGARMLAHTWSRPGHTKCPRTGGIGQFLPLLAPRSEHGPRAAPRAAPTTPSSTSAESRPGHPPRRPAHTLLLLCL